MSDEYTITTRSEGLLGKIGQWGAALITDEELLEALDAHDAEKDRLAEAVQAAYNALHMETRERAIAILHDALSGVVAEEPEWAEEWTAYGRGVMGEFMIPEPKGPNYATHQRVVKAGPWVPVEN